MLLDQHDKLLSRNSKGDGLSIQSLATWRFLFDCQKDFAISGSMTEIGVWRGLFLRRWYACECASNRSGFRYSTLARGTR